MLIGKIICSLSLIPAETDIVVSMFPEMFGQSIPDLAVSALGEFFFSSSSFFVHIAAVMPAFSGSLQYRICRTVPQ